MKPMQAVNSKSKYILGGLILGILFGIGILVIGWSSTILIGICGGAGALIAWVVYGLADGQLDFNAAWRALRRK